MKNSSNPLVSICVTSYNHAQYVLETLDSLWNQNYKPIEIVIVDDHSQDNSDEVIASWVKRHEPLCDSAERVLKYIYQNENRGVCHTLNTAIKNSNGVYISTIGSDDIYLLDKISEQVKLLESADEGVGMLTSAIEFIDEQGNYMNKPDDFAVSHPENIFIPLLERCFIAAMSTLVRRSCYEKVGLFDEKLPFEDWDMWLRIAKEYRILYSPKVSALYRRHSASSFETRKRQDQEGSLMLLNKHRGFSPEADHIIKAQTRLRSELLYQIGSPQAAHWLRVRWQDDHSLISWGLYMCAKLGIPGKSVMKAQRLLGRR
ncbi:glycosyltransferase family 2 protein [Hymenobacter latericoloratus]|nr:MULTISPECIES: glycosyltransferase [Hymenobacter]